LGSVLDAQTQSKDPVPSRNQPIRLYIDCKGLICDYDFIRTEITFVDHVRERQHADVHVLVTAQPTAEGGSEATLAFIGQNEFAGVDGSLRSVSRPADTEDEVRVRLANALKRGLVQYVNRTSRLARRSRASTTARSLRSSVPTGA
jgi:hypothetical protein